MKHNIWSGAGLVVGNMIGVGVLISTGYMAQSMPPIPIMIAWIVGAIIAACGVVAYSGIASYIGESGGEYRFLSDIFHPFLGCLAGTGSLVLGFAAAIAVDAYAIGCFLDTIADIPYVRTSGAVLMLCILAIHAFDEKVSFRAQNTLVLLKLFLIVLFVFLGLAVGSHVLPTWAPAGKDEGFPWRELLANQFWIAFAFSGWNAAIYVAGEFHKPKKDVGKAMMLGLAAVVILYVLLNWVFVSNLTPEKAAAVFKYEETRVTLAHLVAVELFGPLGGQVVSLFVIWLLISSMSAMMVVGPQVYATMARDGFLPSLFRARPGRPPLAAITLQVLVALILLFFQELRETVLAAAAFLMVFSALTALGSLRIGRSLAVGCSVFGTTLRSTAALFYSLSVFYILYMNLRLSDSAIYCLAAVFVGALMTYSWGRSSLPGPAQKPP